MTPLDLLVWSGAFALAITVVAIALGIAVVVVQSARGALKKEKPNG